MCSDVLKVAFMDMTFGRHPWFDTVFAKLGKLGYEIHGLGYWNVVSKRITSIIRVPPFNYLTDAIYGYPRSKVGCAVDFLGLISIHKVERFLKEKKLDIVLATQWYPGLARAAKRAGLTSVLYALDDPYHYSKRFLNYVSDFDVVLTCSRDASNFYRKRGLRSHWLPLACDTDYFYPMKESKELDVSFVGRDLLDRRESVNEFVAPLILRYGRNFHLYGDWKSISCTLHGSVSWKDLNEIYNMTKINISIHRSGARHFWDSLNQRVFDVPGSGSFLLTDNALGIENLFENKKDLVIASNGKEMLELCSYYLENEDEREKISSNGYNKVLKYHTTEIRARQINKILRSIV